MALFGDYIVRIKRAIASKEIYEQYANIFSEYKAYIDKILADNPRDLTAVCQLAAVYMELNEPWEKPITLLEAFLASFGKYINDEDRSRLYTNLAFYYRQEGDDKRSKTSLENAVALEPKTPNAYDALARVLAYKNDLDKALGLFQKARERSGEPKYTHNYAVCLFMSRRYKEAAALFDALLQNDGDNALFMRSAGVCRAYLGDYASAKALADKLRSLGENDDMSESDIAELYYICGEYAAHNAIYDNSRFNYDLDEEGYIAPYLYSLKIIGEAGAIERKYEEIVQKINDDITQAKAPPENEQKRFVKKSRKRLRGVEKLYAAIVNDDFKPQVKIRPYFIENCYLIDCPRHQTAILT